MFQHPGVTVEIQTVFVNLIISLTGLRGMPLSWFLWPWDGKISEESCCAIVGLDSQHGKKSDFENAVRFCWLLRRVKKIGNILNEWAYTFRD